MNRKKHTWRTPTSRAEKIAKRRATMARIREGDGFIYVAEVLGTAVIKIGFSVNPERRARSIYTFRHHGCPRDARVRVVSATPGSFAEEKSLHKVLRRDASALGHEFYSRSILSHPAIPAGLREAAPSRRDVLRPDQGRAP